MNEKTKDVYESLKREVTSVRMLWTFYKQLFETDDNDWLLSQNETLFAFFVFQNLLIDEVILIICRLIDRDKTGKGTKTQDNLSLSQLTELLRSDGSYANLVSVPTEKDSVLTKKIADLKDNKCKNIRDYRNKALAHSDLKLALEKLAERSKEEISGSSSFATVFELPQSLSGVPIDNVEIEVALAGLSDFLNTIEQTVFNNPVAYEFAGPPGGSNGYSLLSLLKDGLEFRKKIDSQTM